MTKTLEEITRDFEKENSKIKVKVVNVPNAGEVLKTRVLAGDVPDVVNIYPQSIELQEWAKAGVFEDLSNKDYLKRVKNGYAEKYAVNEKVYNVPFTANAYGIYYNKDKFEELGLKVPETWDEFEQLVKDIVAKGQTPFGIAGADAWTLIRSWFFFPAVLSGLTVALIFKQVFNYGLPAIGNALHIEFLQTSLLGTKWGAIFAAVFVLLWQGVAMPIIIFLPGLQSIPTEITEAARIDGATSKQVFWNIELPYLLPSVSIVFILALKGGLTAFDQVFAMTGGGPNNATTSLGLLVYNYAFKNNQFGYANAIAVILFFLIVVISIIQLRVSKKFEI
ncbi:TPA: extracellular solute-binding protein [Streptococcus pneumoniae]